MPGGGYAPAALPYLCLCIIHVELRQKATPQAADNSNYTSQEYIRCIITIMIISTRAGGHLRENSNDRLIVITTTSML